MLSTDGDIKPRALRHHIRALAIAWLDTYFPIYDIQTPIGSNIQGRVSCQLHKPDTDTTYFSHLHY